MQLCTLENRCVVPFIYYSVPLNCANFETRFNVVRGWQKKEKYYTIIEVEVDNVVDLSMAFQTTAKF